MNEDEIKKENDVLSEKARGIVCRLTEDEKLSFLTGADVWHTAGCEREGVVPLRMSDGPSGIRVGDDRTVCFPSACALACSFDRDGVYRVGEMIGEEAAANGITLLLAPAMNVKRSPLCGRNFEYYSEDPYLTGELVSEYVKGAQKNVGCCLKHFAVNNQETKRMSVNAEVSERALRDIYLLPFEIAVQKSGPLAVMSSYNKINGIYASENERLLNGVLRREWGFRGMVVSDWGAVNDACDSVRAGLNLEMPGNPANTAKLAEKLHDGSLSERDLNEAAAGVVFAALKAEKYKKIPTDYGRHMEECARIGEGCCVLLKNEDGMLPLENRDKKIAVFGRGAKEPRIQGGGCANVSPEGTVIPLDALKKRYRRIAYVGEPDVREAETIAGEYDACIVFAGLSELQESEGYDRKSIAFPSEQTKLIRAVCRANPNTVVVLTQGGVTELPWIDAPKAVLLTYLLGSAYGETVARVLAGEGEPSGRLAESWIARDEDGSAFPYYGNDGETAEYGESVFVGYRMYLTKGTKVNFPFGYGLSYTAFRFSDVSFSTTEDGVHVSLSVENTGKRGGRTVVQIYAKVLCSDCAYPEAELVGFRKIRLEAGERRKVTVEIPKEDLKRYSPATGKRELLSRYEISVRENSEKVVAKAIADFPVPSGEYTENTCVGRILKEHPEYAERLKGYLCLAILGNFNAEVSIENGEVKGDPLFTHIMNDMPLRALYNLTGGKFSADEMKDIIKKR